MAEDQQAPARDAASAEDACRQLDKIVAQFENAHDHPLAADHLDVLRARVESVKDVLRQLETNKTNRDALAEQLLADADAGRLNTVTVPDHHAAVLAHARAARNGG